MSDLPVVDYWGHGYATGYGVAAQRLAMALIGRGVTLQWTPIDFDHRTPHFSPDRWSHEMLDGHRQARGEPDVIVLHAVPELVPAALEARGKAALVCHTVWETGHIQNHWRDLLNRCDGVIVPTEWNAAAFRASGVTVPIGVVPHIRSDQAVVPDAAWLDHLAGRFLVYTIAAWSPRKTPWRSIETFARAFDADDEGVAMLVKSGREVDVRLSMEDVPGPVRTATWVAMAKAIGTLGRTPSVTLVDHHLTDEQIAGLHGRGDCFVSLPHGEGWDLGAFDAATAGTPVVTTGWGAPLTYLDDDPAQLVPVEEVTAVIDDLRPDPRSRWAEPDIDRAVEMLRAVRADHEAARRRAAKQAARLTTEYAPEVVARTFLSQLDAILGAGR